MVTMAMIGGRLAESNERFIVRVTDVVNARIGDGSERGTMVDDEPRIRITDVTRYEGNRKMTVFNVTLSAAGDWGWCP